MWDWPQLVIVTFGVGGVLFSQVPALARYACFLGLAGQVGWFAEVTYETQPGIFVVCVVYALAWMVGLWTHWLR